jgi:hypothetical protein
VQPHLDENEEGFVEDGGVSRRTVNYSNQEDLVIILAWKKVGLDPAVGTEQAEDTYWEQGQAGKIWGPAQNSKIEPILVKYKIETIANLIDKQ